MPFPPSSLRVLTFATAAVLSSCGGNSTSSDENGKPRADEKSLFLVGAVAADRTHCLVAAEMSAPLLIRGVLDLAVATEYTATLIVGNQLLRTGSATETERISLLGAEITLTTADETVLDTYSTVGTGFVDAASGSAAYGAVSITVIPAELARTDSVQSAELLVAKIRVHGEALDGTSMTSSQLNLPIRVCTGCLVQYPPSAADTTLPPGTGYQCATAQPATSDVAPCAMGQDVPFSCSLCAATLPLCRDPALNPAFSQ